jgi:predicted Zn-dependent protease
LRHNKDLPQAEQTLRSLLSEQPQNGPARENLYYILREQNKTAEAQAMLRTLPESLQQKLQPRIVTGMPGDSLRRQAQEQANSGNVSGAIATLRQGVSRYPDDAWMRLDLARLLQNPAMTARPRQRWPPRIVPAPAVTPLCRRAVCQ